jgi:hypothetical protein
MGCACHSGEIALAASSHLRSTLAAAPVFFRADAHAVVTVAKSKENSCAGLGRAHAFRDVQSV